jgi:hypothetical protein
MNAADKPRAFPVATPGEGTIAKRMAAGLALRPSPLNDSHRALQNQQLMGAFKTSHDVMGIDAFNLTFQWSSARKPS